MTYHIQSPKCKDCGSEDIYHDYGRQQYVCDNCGSTMIDFFPKLEKTKVEFIFR